MGKEGHICDNLEKCARWQKLIRGFWKKFAFLKKILAWIILPLKFNMILVTIVRNLREMAVKLF